MLDSPAPKARARFIRHIRHMSFPAAGRLPGPLAAAQKYNPTLLAPTNSTRGRNGRKERNP